MSDRRFGNKVVVITGGSSGIGRAAALAFAREGARVVIAARGQKRAQEVVHEIVAAGGLCSYVPADMANPADVIHVMEQTVALHGRIDCAFNNAAGEAALMTATADLSEEQFDRAIAVNLKAVWLGMKLQIQQMLKQDPQGGAIVNTSSLNGLGGTRLASVYAMCKAGINSLTKSAAQEYAQQGIRVNALVAGGFETPLLDSVIDLYTGGDSAKRGAVEAQYKQMIPMGRFRGSVRGGGDGVVAVLAGFFVCDGAFDDRGWRMVLGLAVAVADSINPCCIHRPRFNRRDFFQAAAVLAGAVAAPFVRRAPRILALRFCWRSRLD